MLWGSNWDIKWTVKSTKFMGKICQKMLRKILGWVHVHPEYPCQRQMRRLMNCCVGNMSSLIIEQRQFVMVGLAMSVHSCCTALSKTSFATSTLDKSSTTLKQIFRRRLRVSIATRSALWSFSNISCDLMALSTVCIAPSYCSYDVTGQASVFIQLSFHKPSFQN